MSFLYIVWIFEELVLVVLLLFLHLLVEAISYEDEGGVLSLLPLYSFSSKPRGLASSCSHRLS
jgi:hypothetical protein